MARVSYLRREDGSDEDHVAIFDRLESERKMPTPNIFRALAHAPLQLDGLLTYAKSLRAATELGPGLRELVILAIAAVKDGEYVASHHAQDAIKAGFDEEQIAAIASNDQSSRLFSDAELAVIEFGRSVGTKEDVSLDTWERAAEYLDDLQMIQLTLTACWYASGVLMMRILDLNLE
ncbi:hypothetical protein XU06_29320 (plasmid) [Rhodococcus erythropolis]|uniref:carboxymuconolactone decarboxylase family protein n=1 Tax=Rhodococcus erythropolis TaxID=1833 RepID=UPI00061B6E6C|nr:carboxymuconolactone decarboxylase family protein [Rhodococcus erythropolis]AKE01084.1 hypothetical protein XU06_29320 [Rhodococcus erythropolis]